MPVTVDPSDLETFATALRFLVENPGIARRMGNAGRERVTEHFLAASRVADYVSLIGLVEATAATTAGGALEAKA